MPGIGLGCWVSAVFLSHSILLTDLSILIISSTTITTHLHVFSEEDSAPITNANCQRCGGSTTSFTCCCGSRTLPGRGECTRFTRCMRCMRTRWMARPPIVPTHNGSLGAVHLVEFTQQSSLDGVHLLKFTC